MGRLFGTDGVRGLANVSLTPELALAVARASVAVLAPPDLAAVTAHGDPVRPLAVVGRDPRASGEMLEAAVVAGLTSAGADVLRVGVLPTPAISHLTSVYDADLGVMLSASHNPMPDNGIKVFAAGGAKLPDEVEDRIEALVLGEAGAAGEAGSVGEAGAAGEAGDAAESATKRPSGAHVGRVRDAADAAVRYQDFLLAGLDHRLDGLRIVVDCAHGAAAAVAPEVYRRAGAEVLAIAASPDGLNINDGVGSTHLDGLIAAVREHGADLGIAHDGDADRCLAVDGAGEIVDGDQILALCALALRERGALRGDAVVATVMSNIGFHQAMRGAGIEVETTPVGDRYVLEALARRGLSLGGEQSGHVVFADRCSTGDGLLTALTVMSAVAASGRSLAELAAVVQRAPQILVNVAVADKNAVLASPRIAEALRDAQTELGDGGRVLLRPSGTEALFRVMVEAPTQVQADDVARRLAELVAAV